MYGVYSAGGGFRWEVSGLLCRLLKQSVWYPGRIAVLDSTFELESKSIVPVEPKFSGPARRRQRPLPVL